MFPLRRSNFDLIALAVLSLGLLALAVPTMANVARISWSTDQGAHGPLVLATGIWLIARERKQLRAALNSGKTWLLVLGLVPSLLLYVAARVTGVIELEGLALYGAVLSTLYGLVGGRALKLVWFPIFYLAFVLPPPDSLVAALTQPLKIAISQVAISFLFALGYPIGGSGVVIQIAQYQLLVAAACAGLNSMISLVALGLFYVYVRHNLNWRYAALLALACLPVAILANFVRVILLILITYYFGDAAAQGFVHNFAGVTMFVVSLLGIFLLDSLLDPLRRRLSRKPGRD